MTFHKKIHVLAAVLLSGILAFSGCGKKETTEELGRYVEESAAVPDSAVSPGASQYVTCDDGSILSLVSNTLLYKSEDDGATWNLIYGLEPSKGIIDAQEVLGDVEDNAGSETGSAFEDAGGISGEEYDEEGTIPADETGSIEEYDEEGTIPADETGSVEEYDEEGTIPADETGSIEEYDEEGTIPADETGFIEEYDEEGTIPADETGSIEEYDEEGTIPADETGSLGEYDEEGTLSEDELSGMNVDEDPVEDTEDGAPTICKGAVDKNGNVVQIVDVYTETPKENRTYYTHNFEIKIFDAASGLYSDLDVESADLTMSGVIIQKTEDEIWQSAYDTAKSQGVVDDGTDLAAFREQYETMGFDSTTISYVFPDQSAQVDTTGYINSVMMNDSWIFILVNNSKILQIDRSSGEVSQVYQEGSMYTVPWDTSDEELWFTANQSVYCKDLKTGENARTAEISDLNEELSDYNVQTMALSMDKTKVYIACAEGMYVHTIGSSEKMTCLIEGTMSSLCITDYEYYYLCPLTSENFYLVGTDYYSFDSGSLAFSYHYDQTMPKYPEKELSVYSLYKISSMPQILSKFQAQNSDIHVTYTYGRTGASDAVTVNDALKVLNTKILAGNGPDIIFLDGMPINTYIHSGMLDSLDSILENYDDTGLFMNIASGVQDDGHTYAIPLTFKYPVMVGYADEIEDVDTLEELEALVEKIASNTEDTEMIDDITSAKSLIATLFISNSSQLFNDDGTISQKGLVQFLTVAQKMYTLANEHISYNMQENQKTMEAIYKAFGVTLDDEDSTTAMQSQADALSHVGEIYFKQIHFSIGCLTSYELYKLSDATESDSDFIFKAMPGMDENSYVGCDYFGINSLGTHKESAEAFAKFLLSDSGMQEYQKAVSTDGSLPISRKLFKEKINEVYDESQPYFSASDLGMDVEIDSETKEHLDYKKPSQQFFDQLVSLAESLTNPMYTNQSVMETLVSYGKECLEDNEDPAKVADTIIETMDIYLSE